MDVDFGGVNFIVASCVFAASLVLSRVSYNALFWLTLIAPFAMFFSRHQYFALYFTSFGVDQDLVFMASLAVVFAMFMSNLWVVFLGPLVGVWKPFSECYVHFGTVVNAATYTNHYADTTTYRGPMGELKSSTQFSSLSTDEISFVDEASKIHRVSGEGIRSRVSRGDKVLVAGVEGEKHFLFANQTRWSIHDNQPGSNMSVIGQCLLTMIPGVGTLVVLWLFLTEHVSASGVTEAGPFEQESRHVWLMTFVHLAVLAFCIVNVLPYGFMDAVQCFYLVLTPFVIVHAIIWRKNCLRYGKHVEKKVNEVSPFKIS